MKALITIIALTISVTACRAQTFGEWFRQKKTQKKYLIQQIAAFQMYLGYVQKGYSIAEKGLTTISNIKQGDFNLHKDFFKSLRSINPKISNYSRAADVIALQIQTVQIYKQVYRQAQSSKMFNSRELNYINKVFTSLLSDCADIVDELIAVTTNNELEMKDNERLIRIDALYIGMQDNYTFAQSFAREIKLLTVQRMKEKKMFKSSV